MLKVFSEIKTKYILLKEDEKIKEKLSDLTTYMEFVTSLSNILEKDEDYKFFINEKRNMILTFIMNNNFINLESIKQREDNIIFALSELSNYSKEEIELKKEEYCKNKIDALNQPSFLRNEDYSNVIESNYLNLRKLKRIDEDRGHEIDETLKNDKTILYLINTLINEYPKALDNYKFKFIKNIIKDSSREKFETFKDFLYYEMYRITTLGNINKLQNQKRKIKRL